MTPHAGPGPLQVLVVQPTPYCNLDCRYCYLPDRQNTRRMGPEVLDAAFRWTFAGGLVRHPFTVIWHAGEPCVLPPAYYEDAFARLDRANTAGVPVCHSFQTNGTLIDDAWCDFFKAHDILLGVSVDGPAFLHDRFRTTRSGRGTLARVLEGINLLNEKGIPFQALTVLTDSSLDYPDELFDFYRAAGIAQVAFNVEEVEGPHSASSLARPGAPARYARFLGRFLDQAVAADPPMSVRELDTMIGVLRNRAGSDAVRPQEVTPFAIVSVDCDGHFTTFSPELLGLKGEPYGDFALGNVLTDPLEQVLASEKYQRMARDVASGVARCRASCSYFEVCGGVAPVNKFFENGTFDSTETIFCKFTRQVVLDVVLDRLERAVPAGQECPAPG